MYWLCGMVAKIVTTQTEVGGKGFCETVEELIILCGVGSQKVISWEVWGAVKMCTAVAEGNVVHIGWLDWLTDRLTDCLSVWPTDQPYISCHIDTGEQ